MWIEIIIKFPPSLNKNTVASSPCALLKSPAGIYKRKQIILKTDNL